MTRVLFVDDEPKILAGLRRLLYSLRRHWQMDFVSSGAEALQRLSEEPFDVVVTDIRMPGMDGAELLRQVRQLYPGTVRVVLSGQCDQQTVLRCVGPAHQFLAKPCEAETLRNTVVRASHLREQLGNEQVKQAVCHIQGLPLQNDVYDQLLSELSLDEPSADRAAALVKSDVAASAKVLQLVSSSFFGSPQRVADPVRAATLLGVEILQGLTQQKEVFRPLEGTGELAEHLAAINRSSLAVAEAARAVAMAETEDAHLVGDAYLAGMFHLLGSVVLLDVFGTRYAGVLQKMREGVSRADAEKELFGATHDEVSAYLAGLWGLPDPVVQALAHYRRPDRSEQQQFSPLTALHVAAACVPEEQGRAAAIGRPDTEYLQRIGCADRLQRWQQAIDQCQSQEVAR